jgi:hypothetical protein
MKSLSCRRDVDRTPVNCFENFLHAMGSGSSTRSLSSVSYSSLSKCHGNHCIEVTTDSIYLTLSYDRSSSTGPSFYAPTVSKRSLMNVSILYVERTIYSTKYVEYFT